MTKKTRVLAFLLALLMVFGSVSIAAAASKTMVVRSGSKVNMRSTPQIAKNIITRVSGGTTVTVMSTTGKWSYIKLPSGLTCYMMTSFLRTPAKKVTPTPTPKPASGTYKYVKTLDKTGLNMRSGPGGAYPVIKVLRDGTRVQVLSTNKYWSKISYNGKTGYVYSSYLSKTK